MFTCLQKKAAADIFHQDYFWVSIHIYVYVYSHTCIHIYIAPEQNMYLYMALDNLTTWLEVLLNIIACVSGDDYCASYHCCLSVILELYPTLRCVSSLNFAERLLTSVHCLLCPLTHSISVPYFSIPLSWSANFRV